MEVRLSTDSRLASVTLMTLNSCSGLLVLRMVTALHADCLNAEWHPGSRYTEDERRFWSFVCSLFQFFLRTVVGIGDCIRCRAFPAEWRPKWTMFTSSQCIKARTSQSFVYSTFRFFLRTVIRFWSLVRAFGWLGDIQSSREFVQRR